MPSWAGSVNCSAPSACPATGASAAERIWTRMLVYIANAFSPPELGDGRLTAGRICPERARGGQLNLVRLAGLPCARLARSKRHARTEPALRCSGYDSRNDLDLRRSQISAWRAVGRTPSFRVQATLVTAWQGDLWGSVPECVSHAQNQGHRPSAALPPWLQCPVPQRVKVGELRKQMPPLRRSESPAGAAPQLRTASPAL
jgi:hypothetical protein